MFTNTATASGCSETVRSTWDSFMPSAMPRRLSMSGFTYMGMAPQSTRALMTLLWTFLGRMILSPFLQTASTMLWTEDVVPPTMRKAQAAPKASAASSSASRITDTGWQRLSSAFMEFTSMDTHCFPRSFVSSGLPCPLLCPGTSKGTIRSPRNTSSAS